ncbi:response regulator [Salmonella enterica]|uniref:Response regulator n=1 Tax=Salmonella enterica TaxID=28901 RepID=A0A745KGQ8_SALER|nr:response regulator [Salmonella enterica]EAC0681092.1 response regulator [Salmonella enterica subsp. enterica serovar Molade]EBW8766523.1 response regulator [Salmonella enterica subsp. enterica serovar California]ECD3895561.1 response regulator [Salmonella enterica subsp. enterica serovar Gloucester]ECR5743998.1 response regulator [Salmonella enterica subsp. enterica serovar Derby]EDT7084107.1 response regulator [Salmonella enterica subsp. enterica]EDW5367051.1 response regulator [Salmonell
MSQNNYLIDKRVILDCERMTLSCAGESITISESERSLLIAFHEGLFKKDDLINYVWGRKGVVVSDASYYKLINQLRGSFDKIGLKGASVVTRPRVGVLLSVSIEPLSDEAQNTPLPAVAETELSTVEVRRDDTIIPPIPGAVNKKDWLYFCLAALLMFFMMYKVKSENIDYFTLQGSYDGYTFYSVGHDKTHLTDIVEAYSEMSNEIHKQNGKIIYYIRVPNTNIFVQCLNQLDIAEPKCISIKERY